MSHWISDNREELESAAEKYGWNLEVSENYVGAVTLTKPETDREGNVISDAPDDWLDSDVNGVSIVRPKHTRTVSVEYDPSNDATDAVRDKQVSWRWGEEDAAVEWAINIMEMHEDKN